ncbi:MAG: hypothetical protein WBA71_04670 [Candidatus Humimicrobiia bacterium]
MNIFMKGSITIYPYLFILENYTKDLEILLEKKIKEFKEMADKEIENLKNLTFEEKNHYIDSLIDEYHMLKKAYTNFLRTSVFIACFSLLEHELIFLCEQVQKKKNPKTKFKNFKKRGGIIYRTKDYIEKEAKISLSNQKLLWDDLNNYRLIRNILVHNQGRFDNSKRVKKVEEFVNNKNWLELDKLNRIQFKKGFLKEVKKTIEDFSKELSKALK